MTTGSAMAGPVGRAPRAPVLGLAATLVATGLATVAAAALGSPALALVPVLGLTLAWIVARVPLRWTAAVLLVLLLSLDSEEDAQGLWHSPLVPLGNLLRYNLDRVFAGQVPNLLGLGKLSGLEIVLVALFAVAAYRRIAGSTLDGPEVQTAGVAATAMIASLVGIGYGTVVGLATGGSTSAVILQIRPLLHVPLLFFLFQAAFRGPRDHVLVARAVVLSALLKAAQAVWVTRTFKPAVVAAGHQWVFATNHGDSVLFVVAAIALFARWMERCDARRLAALAVLLPPILWGMLANNRRIAWVALALSFAVVFAVTPWRPWKRSLVRLGLVAVPVAALYVAVGWGSSAGVFAPVRVLRTLVDAKVDRSTLYRQVENFNLVLSIRDSGPLGRGFGHPFTVYLRGDDISSIFSLFAYEPHNSVLGLLLFAGVPGFLGVWMPFSVGVFLAARSYRRAGSPDDRAAALVCLSALLACAVLTYGDLGQFFTQWQVFTALAVAVAGKLAVATGAWPRRVRLETRAGIAARPAEVSP